MLDTPIYLDTKVQIERTLESLIQGARRRQKGSIKGASGSKKREREKREGREERERGPRREPWGTWGT